MSDNSTLFKYQWNISKLTKNGEVYNFSKGSSEIKVAIIDSGIDYTHENLLSNIDFQNSRSFVGEHTNIMDYDGHGTMVAGIICGNGILTGLAPNIFL
ncbi:S8 family serine peptidase [Lysinibacillus sp. CD3-6]|uniref:S8 family serine peptidase n=1 Tax=Lysinibacillus sp. CD3-6 TaxID=2892541 RepID=UPI00116F9277|nr:S8 family serine peptidase [Lysinibacillus sp. CD3-6]